MSYSKYVGREGMTEHKPIKSDLRELTKVLEAEFGSDAFLPEKLDNPNHVTFTSSADSAPYFSVALTEKPGIYSVHVELYGPEHEQSLGIVDGV